MTECEMCPDVTVGIVPLDATTTREVMGKEIAVCQSCAEEIDASPLGAREST